MPRFFRGKVSFLERQAVNFPERRAEVAPNNRLGVQEEKIVNKTKLLVQFKA